MIRARTVNVAEAKARLSELVQHDLDSPLPLELNTELQE